jgi:DNA-binding MarR family transcriptional regulator
MAKGKQKNPEPSFVIADRLHSAAIHLLRRVRKQDTATGEGPARLSALSVLVFGGPMTLGQLAAAEQVKPPTMSRIVTGLKKSGLVNIVPDPADTRRIQIYPTAKGTEILHEGRRRRVAALADQLETLQPRDKETLLQAADLIGRLSKYWRA